MIHNNNKGVLSFFSIIIIILLSTTHYPRYYCEASYISYGKPNYYQLGDRIPISVNKLTSPITLSSLDFNYGINVGLCSTNDGNDKISRDQSTSSWHHAMQSIHGDSLYTFAEDKFQYSNLIFDNIDMLQDLYCQYSCSSVWNNDNNIIDNNEYDNNNDHTATLLKTLIHNDYRYQYYIDQLPVAYRYEDQTQINVRYWGGIPIGRKGSDIDNNELRYSNVQTNDIYVYNHYNILIYYNEIINNDQQSHYTIVRVVIEPMSIRHDYIMNNNSIITPIESCQYNSNSGINRKHTNYDMLLNIEPMQLLSHDDNNDTSSSSSPYHMIHYTYDVIWIQSNVQYKNRWDVYLSMDDSQSTVSFVMGVILGFIIFIGSMGSLYIWVMRDLSYKPINLLYETEDLLYDQHHDQEVPENAPLSDDNQYNNSTSRYQDSLPCNDHGDGHDSSVIASIMMQSKTRTMMTDDNEQQKPKYDEHEIQMWPLSTRLFFPPSHMPMLLCIIAGIGSQNLISGFIFIVFVRCGILSQASSTNGPNNNLLTGGAIIYFTCSPICGGYITSRLYRIFHGEKMLAIAASLITAIIYPLIGMFVIWIVYDILPHTKNNDIGSNTAPPYFQAMANSTPVVYIWIFFSWPMTILFGWLGYRAGPLNYFPVSKGISGYQDLDLQQPQESSSSSPITNVVTMNTTADSTKISSDISSLKEEEKKGDDDMKSIDNDDDDIVQVSKKPSLNPYGDDHEKECTPVVDDDDDNEHVIKTAQSFNSYGMNEVEEMPSNYYVSDDYSPSVCDEDDKKSGNNEMSKKTNTNTCTTTTNTNQVKYSSCNWYNCMFCKQKLQWKTFRLPVLFIACGILPVLSAFVNYSYGVVGPIFLGYYSNCTLIIISFILFCLNSAAVTVLIYYRQIRLAGSHNQSYYYQWWWASIVSGASSGFYLFILSMSWLVHIRIDQSYNVSTSTWIGYVIWFTYISFGVGLMTAFCGLAGCIIFNRTLYVYLIQCNNN